MKHAVADGHVGNTSHPAVDAQAADSGRKEDEKREGEKGIQR